MKLSSVDSPWRFISKKARIDAFHLSHIPSTPCPNQVVHTSRYIHAGKAFTLYTLLVTCPITNQHWTTHKRYHDFVVFRQQLSAFKSFSNTIMVPVVEKLLSVQFPKKHWFNLTKNNTKSVSERAAHLNNFVWKLMEMRTEMGLYRHLHHLEWPLFNRLYACMEAFLEVPLFLREMQFCQDDLDGDCVICTNPQLVPGVGRVVELPCGHSFHTECIFDWFRRQTTCPLCRANTNRVIALYSPASLPKVAARS
ncbi:hypothetical protein THRCLA_01318 [Thraustotheca clavata]|uniref:RING-type domain-containing protein n=1 Tax=Thraustotheca clavata TaxID=74557 RepID=A0A1W0A8U4_9STRA|nr:hypothetical protein THRCLA_01318 [Thraustotheca clavata]